MRNFRLTSLALLLLGVILNSCSKDNNGGGDNSNNPAGQGGGSANQYKIVFTTDKAIGEKISIECDTNIEEDMREVWIDFNNNGIREKGEFEVKRRNFFNVIEGIVGSQTITIYGKVTDLLFRHDLKITAIDTSKNIYLETFSIKNGTVKTLDLTHNPNIEGFAISTSDENIKEAGLESLSVSPKKNPKLGSIRFFAKGMKTLDISNFPELSYLSVGGSVENLKITNNPNLESLNFGYQYGIKYDLKSKNLEIRNNPKIKDLDFKADEIKSVDLSNNPNLESLMISIASDTKCDFQKINLVNTPKLTFFRFLVAIEGNTPLCVQVDADRVNNIPKGWSKSEYDKKFNIRTTINYQSTPCP